MATQHQLGPCRNCDGENVALRQRRLRDGARQFLGQCQHCGQGTKAVKAPALAANVPPFDAAFREASRAAEHQGSPEMFSTPVNSPAWRERYEAHMASDKWARLRAKVMTRSAGICEGCLEEPATAVHHLTYKHLGDELLWELVAVCKNCHARCHPHLND